MFNIAERLLESLGEHALQEIASCWGARGDLRKLGNSVRMIKARVRDAEKRGEEEDNDAIKEWLKRLRLVLHQAEVLTIDLQNKRVEGNNKLVKKVRVLFSRSGPLYLNIKIKSSRLGKNLTTLSRIWRA